MLGSWRTNLGALLSRRGLLVGLALLGYCAGTLGIPVPQTASASSRSRSRLTSKSCCCRPVETCAKPCCCCRETQAVPPAQSTAGFVWIDALSARQCQGLDTTWIGGEMSLPPPQLLTWSFSWVLRDSLAISEPSEVCHFARPPTPPPRPATLAAWSIC